MPLSTSPALVGELPRLAGPHLIALDDVGHTRHAWGGWQRGGSAAAVKERGGAGGAPAGCHPAAASECIRASNLLNSLSSGRRLCYELSRQPQPEGPDVTLQATLSARGPPSWRHGSQPHLPGRSGPQLTPQRWRARGGQPRPPGHGHGGDRGQQGGCVSTGAQHAGCRLHAHQTLAADGACSSGWDWPATAQTGRTHTHTQASQSTRIMAGAHQREGCDAAEVVAQRWVARDKLPPRKQVGCAQRRLDDCGGVLVSLGWCVGGQGGRRRDATAVCQLQPDTHVGGWC
jgi:hypothetical protein